MSGTLLKQARLRAELSRAGLARRTGKATSVIGRWERGEVKPSLETRRELLRACGLELDLGLRRFDDFQDAAIESALALTPSERLDQLGGLDRARSPGAGERCLSAPTS